MPLKRKYKKKEEKKAILTNNEPDKGTFVEDPVKKKLSFDDLSPAQRLSLLTSSKQPILLYCRVRPQLPDEISRKELPSLHIVDPHTLMSLAPEESFTYKSTRRGLAQSSQHFYFNHVFGPESTQQSVFTESIVASLKDFLDGQNCLVFSYGVTNSGKTHTIHGTADDPGIVPRVLDSVFASLDDSLYQGDHLKPKNYSEVEWLSGKGLEKEKGIREQIFSKAHSMDSSVNSSAWSSLTSTFTTFADMTTCSSECTQASLPGNTSPPVLSGETSVIDVDVRGSVVGVWLSCAEIYNEFIYDLFSEVPAHNRRARDGKKPNRPVLRCAEDSNSNVFIKGLTEVQVKSVEEAKLLAAYGQCNRKIGSTALNQKSSRSHCVFMIKTVRMADSRRPKQAIVNRMSIVDLAGSERSRKTQASGKVIKEAGNINVSLHILSKCINAMRHTNKKEKSCVPFRESKLTQIFQNYFVSKGRGMREGRVMMFVNVSPSPVVFDETLNVLEVSSIASKVVPFTRPGRGAGACGGVVGIENIEESPLTQPASPLPKCEGGDEESDGDETPRPRNPVVGFVTPGPTGGMFAFHGQQCAACEQLKSIISELKTRVVDLNLKLWEQEHVIRGEVCKEFHDQIVEIEDQHKVGLSEQADEIELMYEQRLQLLTQSIKKTVHRKKRKIEEAEFCETEYSVLQDRISDLEAKISAKDNELEKAQSHLKDLMYQYESTTVERSAAANEVSMKASRLEKQLQLLEEQLAFKSREVDSMQAMEKEMKEMRTKFKDLEELHGSLQEVNTHLEDELKTCRTNLSEARTALKDMTDQEGRLEDLSTRCRKAEKKVEQVLSENTSLQGKLSSLTASMEEMKALSTQKEANLQAQADSRYQAMEGQLDKVRAWLMEAEKQLVLAQEQAKTKEEALKEKESKLEELTKKSVSAEHVVVLEHRLEKAQSVEEALRDELLMTKIKLNEEKSSLNRQLATMTASYELQLGELKTKLHEHKTMREGQSLQPSSSGLCLVVSESSDNTQQTQRKTSRLKRTRGKRCTGGQTPQATSDSSSVFSLKSLLSVDSLKTAHHVEEESSTSLKTAHHMVEEERASLKNASCEDKENIHHDPCSLLEGKDNNSHRSLPNIESSSQLIDPDPSDVSRAVIDVTYAKIKKTRRKRAPAAKTRPEADTRACTPTPVQDEDDHDSSDDFTPPKKAKRNPKSKKGKEKNPPADVQDSHQEQDRENTPKEKGSLKKKLGRIISKSATARKVVGHKLTDSTNTPDRDVDSDCQQKLSKTAGSRKKAGIRKSQISGPLDLMASPEVTGGPRNKHAMPMNWDLRRRQAVNYGF